MQRAIDTLHKINQLFTESVKAFNTLGEKQVREGEEESAPGKGAWQEPLMEGESRNEWG